MDLKRAATTAFDHGDTGRFTGSVWLNPGLSGPDGTGVVQVSFEPGARTHWHQHPAGQFVAVVSGRGRIASRGEATEEIVAGDIAFTPAGEWHWHGAATDAPMVHVAVNGGGAPEWGEPVADEEYAG